MLQSDSEWEEEAVSLGSCKEHEADCWGRANGSGFLCNRVIRLFIFCFMMCRAITHRLGLIKNCMFEKNIDPPSWTVTGCSTFYCFPIYCCEMVSIAFARQQNDVITIDACWAIGQLYTQWPIIVSLIWSNDACAKSSEMFQLQVWDA